MDGSRPKRKRFVAVADRPSAALVARQTEATALAFRTLGTVDAARAFLNGVDEALGGRPLDVAGASAEGLSRVAGALTDLLHATPASA